MLNKRAMASWLAASCLVLNAPIAGQAAPGKALEAKTDRLQGAVRLDQDFWRSLGVSLSGESAPYKVARIENGSAAQKANLAVNDRILHARMDHNQVLVDIERGGKRFAVSLYQGQEAAKNKAPLTAASPVSAQVNKEPAIKAALQTTAKNSTPALLGRTPPGWNLPRTPPGWRQR